MLKLPEKLTKLRKAYSYSQSYIADLLGIDALEYMNYENGKTLPKISELKILAKFYKISLDSLVINDLDITIQENDRYDIDKENYNYLKRMAKKEKRARFLKKNRNTIFLAIALVLILAITIILWPKDTSVDLELAHKASIKDRLDASDTTVIYIDKDGKVTGTGDNTNSQLDIEANDVLSVHEGSNFTVALRSDGTIAHAGLITRLSDELDQLVDIVKVDVGSGHIVALDKTGHVTCVGDDSYGQCAIDDMNGVVDIFADENASVIVKSDGTIEAYGDFIGKDELVLTSIVDMDISTFISAFVDEEGHVTYYTAGQVFDEANSFKDIVEVAVGDSFIAALDRSGKIHIDLAQNDVLTDEVDSWMDVEAIAAGKDYLVALINGEIYGVGNNDYGQFTVEESQKTTLASVTNVKVSYTENDLIITFDKVANATAYNLRIDVGMGIAITSTSGQFIIPLSRFEDGERYTISITTKGDNDRYEDSAPSIINFLFTMPSDDEEVEELYTLDRLTGKSEDEFLAYLDSFGVLSEHIIKMQSDIICEGDEEIVTSVEGIKDYETLTLSDLLTRDIIYYTCDNTIEETPDPVPTGQETIDGQDISDQG